MKRTPLRRLTPLRSKPSRRTRPAVPLAAWCEARLDVCTGRAEHRHHVILRSQGGEHGPTKDLCHACHGWVHANPNAARALGLIEKKPT